MCMYIIMWLDFGNCMTTLSKSILLWHYPFMLSLKAWVNWSTFLKSILVTLKSHNWDNGTNGGHLLGSIDLKLFLSLWYDLGLLWMKCQLWSQQYIFVASHPTAHLSPISHLPLLLWPIISVHLRKNISKGLYPVNW